MQSLVLAFGVLRNHSITMMSSSSMGWPSGPSTAAVALRFLGFGGPLASDVTGEGTDTASSASSAFRLWLSFAEGTVGEARGVKEGPGLPPRPATASAPFGELAVTRARGLLARTPFGITRGFGAFGLVARFATTECPPCPGVGEVARELGVEVTLGRDGSAEVA